jgi:DNA-binding GntR family transcriptional regulator
MMKTAKSENKKDLVYECIKKKIIANQLEPLELLNEAVLAAELKVSKTPVREAMHQLEKDGLIICIPQKGWFVSEINIKDIRELFEVREIMECAAVRMAVLKGDVNKFIALRDKLSETSNGKNPTNLLKSGELIHVSIIESLQNKRLQEIFMSLMEHHARTRIYFVSKFDELRLEDASQEHRGILDAIIARNPEAAAEQMRNHLHNGFANIKRVSINF